MELFTWTLSFLSLLPIILARPNLSDCAMALDIRGNFLFGKNLSDGIDSPKNAIDRFGTYADDWCPNSQINKDTKDWIQVDFYTEHLVTMIWRQGHFKDGNKSGRLEPYTILYWRPELAGKWADSWAPYKNENANDILIENLNTEGESMAFINPPLVASRIRIISQNPVTMTLCMEMEIFGCVFGDILSYAMPQGTIGTSRSFLDHSYDGVQKNGMLNNGLGQLTDGEVGSADFDRDLRLPMKERHWVGWRWESLRELNNSLQIVFKFKSNCKFHAVSIHTCNQFNKGVRIFRAVQAEFSKTGERFDEKKLVYSPPEDNVSEAPRFILMDLDSKTGSFVRLTLYFASNDILISEVYFVSDKIGSPIRGKSTDPLEDLDFMIHNETYVEANETQKIGDPNGSEIGHNSADGKLSLLFLAAGSLGATMIGIVFVVRKLRICLQRGNPTHIEGNTLSIPPNTSGDGEPSELQEIDVRTPCVPSVSNELCTRL